MNNTTPKQTQQMLDRLLKVAQILKQSQQQPTRQANLEKGQSDATQEEE